MLQDDETWIYPATEVTMELADLLPIEDYTEKRKLPVGGYGVEWTEVYAGSLQRTNNKLICGGTIRNGEKIWKLWSKFQ